MLESISAAMVVLLALTLMCVFCTVGVEVEAVLVHFMYNILCTDEQRDTVAEWLRRSTRNRLGLSRVGSSPASVDLSFLHRC